MSQRRAQVVGFRAITRFVRNVARQGRQQCGLCQAIRLLGHNSILGMRCAFSERWPEMPDSELGELGELWNVEPYGESSRMPRWLFWSERGKSFPPTRGVAGIAEPEVPHGAWGSSTVFPLRGCEGRGAADLDRQLYRAMDQLERRQRQRRGENVPPPLNAKLE